MKVRSLKSGTDIRGIALGQNAAITPELAKRLGFAFVKWLQDRDTSKELSIALGRDSRLSGEALLNACSKGMRLAGAKVYDFGLCTTPAMYQSLSYAPLNLSASIMLTASHHPSNRNGFKFFVKAVGGISSKMLDEILSKLEEMENSLPSEENLPEDIKYCYLDVYKEYLKSVINEKLDMDVACPLLGIHVVVDAGNGAGGFYADLLRELGAWTEGSQFLEPDGNFPNHAPNPEDMEAMHSLSRAVIVHSADLGVIFDADCDRAAIVDCEGSEINRNRLIALISAILLDDEPGATIVTDSVTSSGLAKFIGEWGGEHYRYKRGYRNVIDEAKRLNESGINCPLAIETSGHAAFRENDFIDDGMYLATILIAQAIFAKQEGKDMFDVLDSLEEPVESAEIRLPILSENFREDGIYLIDKVISHANEHKEWRIAPDNREGIRISFDLDGGSNNGWFLLRLSVHDPNLPINVESDVEGGVRYMLRKLYDVIKGSPNIDFMNLTNFLSKN